MGQSVNPSVVKEIATYIYRFIDEYVIKNPGTYNGSKGSYGHDLNMYFNRKVENINSLHTAVPLILYFWNGENDKLIKYINKLKSEGWVEYPSDTYSKPNTELIYNLYYAFKQLKDRE